MNRTYQEIKLPLYPNFELAAKHWPNPNGIPVLAMHGWLDNAASFDLIAPYLPNLDFIALDFAGHGLSSHKPASCFFHILDLVIESFKVIEKLGWDSCMIIGHSLGAGIGSLMAGTTPEKISKLVLVDGLGGLSAPAEQAPAQLQSHLTRSLSSSESKVPVYTSFDQALAARQKVSHICEAGLRAIVERGTKEIEAGYTWRTDPRLLKPSAVYLTEEQNLAFLRRIRAQTLVIRPEPGYPFNQELIARRTSAIQNLTLEKIPGQHHVHLDHPKEVAALIQNFINS